MGGKKGKGKPTKTTTEAPTEPPHINFHVFGHFLYTPKGEATRVTPFAFNEPKASGLVITTHGIRKLDDGEVCREVERFKREIEEQKEMEREHEKEQANKDHAEFKKKQAEAKAGLNNQEEDEDDDTEVLSQVSGDDDEVADLPGRMASVDLGPPEPPERNSSCANF